MNKKQPEEWIEAWFGELNIMGASRPRARVSWLEFKVGIEV